MDPENDLYSLAGQAGVMGPSVPDFGIDPNSLQAPDSTPSEGAFSGVTGNLTDEDILGHFVPPPSDEGAVTQPSQVDPLQFNTPSPSKVKVGGSVTTKGYSEGKNQQIARGPRARLNQEIAGIQQEGAVEGQQRSEPAVAAAEEEKQAALGESTAEANYKLTEGKLKGTIAKITSNYDQQTEKVIAEGQAQAAVAKASYVAALNDYRAARVNPAQLWDNLSGAEQFGMTIAAGIQDFLGAGGIHTSAMATWNKAVDRNIDAQVKAIETKGKVADGFKTLWDMQMAESGSKEEARIRMRGFMLDSLKTGVEAHMAQYGAALATAKGQAAIAKIDQELVKTINEVNKHQDTKTAQRIQQAIQMYGDELQASTAYARIAADKEIAEANRKAAAGPADPYEGLVFDTTESGNGKPIAVFNPDIKPEERKAFREKQTTASYLVKLSRDYQNMLLKYKNQGLLAGTRWQDTDTAKLRELATEMLSTRVLQRSGKAATDAEIKRLQSATPEALFGGQFNVREVLAQSQKQIQDELAITQQAIAHPLHPADPRAQLPNPLTRQGETEYSEAGLIESGKDREEDIEKSIAKGRIKGLEKHTANKVADSPPADVYADYKRFTADYGAEGYDSNKLNAGTNQASSQPRNYAAALTGLKRDATFYKAKAEELSQSTDPAAKAEAKYYADLYQERVDILRHTAKPVTVGTDPADRQGLYSIMILQDLGEDSGAPHEDLSTEGSTTAHEEMPK